jgi:myo-inositol 2-dehydrogenase/D-chiro-inositol 1-dehydrogenase
MTGRTRAPNPIGLAIVGAGRIGLIRGEIAAGHPSVRWIGIAEVREDRGKDVASRIGADFVTGDFRELLQRSEVTAAVIATDEHLHVEPILTAVERRLPLLVEKPLATELAESEQVLKAIEAAGVDAVVGYTQRFRRRFLAVKEKIRSGALGDVTLVTSRAFMNRLVAIDNYTRTEKPERISPMVISGTHALDVVMWLLEGKTPVEVYARSVDRVLGPTHKGIDLTAGLITMDDGTLYHLNISWSLPVVWPGSVYSLEIGVVGTEGVITIDDTHRDVVLATTRAQPAGYTPEVTRHVDFLGSYPPGDVALGELWGPMREETNAWLGRLALGRSTPHATAAEAHNRLMLTKAMDLSARRRRSVRLPITAVDEQSA